MEEQECYFLCFRHICSTNAAGDAIMATLTPHVELPVTENFTCGLLTLSCLATCGYVLRF